MFSNNSGYSSNSSVINQTRWKEFNQIRRDIYFSKEFNDRIESLGYSRYPDDQICPETQLLTVYAYPEELNYPAIRQKKNWFNLELFTKLPVLPNEELISNIDYRNRELAKLGVPTDFLASVDTSENYSGKLIYLSMGSMGSVDLTLMRKLVKILSRTNHKYIVSKGHLHQQYGLAANMWGERYLPQVGLLPYVDLVITHGGNNTVTETFIYGKPMVVLPIFVDQYDNAQRLAETGYGLRLDPYDFTEDDGQLIAIVDQALYDEQMTERCRAAARRMQFNATTIDRHEELAVKIEQLLSNHKK